MKPVLIILILCAFVRSGIAAPGSAVGRSIKDIDIIPASVLQRNVSAKFYKTLLISPIEGYVLVRGTLVGASLSGLKIVRSEPNDLNNHLALQRASEVQMAGNYTLDRLNKNSSVLVHLLLYRTADGTLALSFANMDVPGGNQMEYFGSARLAVLKNDGKWVNIKGPTGLEGKGMAVRQGIRNDLGTSMKLERLTTAAEATNMGAGR